MARNKYDIDETLERKLDFSKLKRALVYVKPNKWMMLLALSLSVVSSLLSLATPTFMQKTIDECIPNKDIAGIVYLAVLTAVFIALSCVLGALRGIVMSRVGQSIVYRIRKDLFAHLQKLSFTYYDSRPHGKILVRVVNYVNNVSDTISNGIVNAVLDILNVFFISIYMFMLSPKLAFVILCGVPVLLAIIFLIKNAQKKSYFIYNNKNSNLTAYTCESINGVMVSQVFNRQDENTAIYKQLNMIYRKAWYKMCVWVNTLAPVSENLKQLVITFVYLAGILWISPSIEVGVLIAMTTYAGQFWQPIINLAAVYNNFLTAISYLERIFQTLDEPVEITDGENAKPLENMQGNVEFNNVCFAYEADKPVLENVSFSVEKGQSIALVGPTGAGKSTIVNLLSRFYNIDSGEILIDGVSISDITVHSLRSQMGIMLQDSFIFSGTIADNIRYGKLDATTDEIVAAAKAVCADEFIRSKPKGYDTVVNENGGGLSQGEKQLIAFARTMLSNPAILVLDEATSSIDPKTERLLQQGIANLLKGRTSFIIAHRLSTIKSCDNIMVIKNGGIFESGTHDELMSKKGEYYRLNMAQKSFD